MERTINYEIKEKYLNETLDIILTMTGDEFSYHSFNIKGTVRETDYNQQYRIQEITLDVEFNDDYRDLKIDDKWVYESHTVDGIDRITGNKRLFKTTPFNDIHYPICKKVSENKYKFLIYSNEDNLIVSTYSYAGYWLGNYIKSKIIEINKNEENDKAKNNQ
jgi:hypothetical protein